MRATVWEKKRICVLLAVAVLFLCGCHIQMRTDSLLHTVKAEGLTSTYFSAISFSQYQQVDSEEASGLRNVSRIMANQSRVLEKTEMEGGMEVFLPVFEPGITAYIAKMFMRSDKISTGSRNVVIRFIHRKDGAKDKHS